MSRNLKNLILKNKQKKKGIFILMQMLRINTAPIFLKKSLKKEPSLIVAGCGRRALALFIGFLTLEQETKTSSALQEASRCNYVCG